MSHDPSKQLVDRVRAGDDDAARELFNRYVERLIRLTQRRLSPKLARRVDPEDIVQSAYRSFFVRVADGQFEIRRSGDLWRLLAAIALNKLRMQAKFHAAQKRNMGKENSFSARSSLLGVAPEKLASEPTPDEAAAAAECLEKIMADLKPLERRMLELRLQSYTFEEIGDELNRSERTVRRLIDRLKERLEIQLMAEDGTGESADCR